MVFFNYATMQMAAKIVYYGPGLCGKTTNLHHIYAKTSPQSRGEMVSLETETDRTLFFDLLPIDVGVIGGFKTRLQLYTVPGQVFYNTTRKLVLKGVDGIVFVADSQKAMLEANVESFKNLRENLAEIGLDVDEVPVVVQVNKRDLPNIHEVETILTALDAERRLDHVEAVAFNGGGVFETLKLISKLTLRTLRRRMTGEDPPKAPRREVAQFRVKDEPPATVPSPARTMAGTTPAPAAPTAPASSPGVASTGARPSAPAGAPVTAPVSPPAPAPRAAPASAPASAPAAAASALPAAAAPAVAPAAQQSPAFTSSPPAAGGTATAARAARPATQVAPPPPLIEEVPAPAAQTFADSPLARSAAGVDSRILADAPVAARPPTFPLTPIDLDDDAPAPTQYVPPPAAAPPPPSDAPARESGGATVTRPGSTSSSAQPASDGSSGHIAAAPISDATPHRNGSAAASDDIAFSQTEKPAKPPAVKHVKVRTSVDVMAELEALRKRATSTSTPKPPRRETTAADIEIPTPKPRRDLNRSLAMQVAPGVLGKTKTLRITVSFENDEGAVQRQEQTLELGDVTDVHTLAVNLKIEPV